MHQTTVAKLEAGSKPLRLNEVAAIASYFEVPIEALWDPTSLVVSRYELVALGQQIEAVMQSLAETRAELKDADAELAQAKEIADAAMTRQLMAAMRQRDLKDRLAGLGERQKAAQATLSKPRLKNARRRKGFQST